MDDTQSEDVISGRSQVRKMNYVRGRQRCCSGLKKSANTPDAVFQPRDGPVPRVLELPVAPSVRYERNTIKSASCEWRFPTLLDFESKPLQVLQKALRKEFPLYERKIDTTVELGTGGPTRSDAPVFVLRATKGKWAVAFRSYSVSLETNSYSSFEEFDERLERVVKVASGIIDSDFLTRVGLRYINALPVGDDDFAGWVNDVLIAPYIAGVYGDVEIMTHQVRGSTKLGQFLFQHGIAAGSARREYILDADMYSENVDVADMSKLVRSLHEQGFALFSWAIGPKAKKFLGTATPKKGGRE